MDDERILALHKRIERLQKVATVYIVCLVVYYYIIKIRCQSSVVENEAEGIKEALIHIAEAFIDSTAALRESTAAYERVNKKLPISEAELWKLLEELRIESHSLYRAYLYLVNNPDMIRALLGCPKDKQRELLLEMVFGSVGSSRGHF